jgi:WD40 repeat protein
MTLDDAGRDSQGDAARSNGRHLVITVHGIRTFGQWQERLEVLAKQVSPGIEVYNYHYGYFSVLAFLIPPLRWIVTLAFRKALLTETRKGWERVDVVAHSFGTHLVAWALYRIPAKDRPRIHTVILAGSVLKPSFPWHNIVIDGGIKRLINDCGIRDNVLIANQLFVLFSGLAGRIGFSGMTHGRCLNRYFDFSHSGYFLANGDFNDDFMKQYWIPLLILDEPVQRHDARQSLTLVQGLILWLINNAEPIKLTVYAVVLAIPLVVYYGLYQNAEIQRRQAERQRMIALARSAYRIKRPDTAVLVGVEANRLNGIKEAQEALLHQLRNIASVQRFLHGYAQIGELYSASSLEGLYTIPLLDISPDGKLLVVAGPSQTASLVDSVQANSIHAAFKIEKGFLPYAVFNADGSALWAVSQQGSIKEWNLQFGRYARAVAFSPFQLEDGVTFRISPDHRFLAIKGQRDPYLVVVDLTTGLEVALPEPPLRCVDELWRKGCHWDNIAFSFKPDLAGLVAWNTIDVLNLKRSKRLARFQVGERVNLRDPNRIDAQGDGVTDMAFSPDRETLAVSAGRRIWFFDLATRAPVFNPHEIFDVVYTLSFSSQGDILAAGTESGAIVLVDTNVHQSPNELIGHTEPVRRIVVRPHGRRFASYSDDGTIILWDLDEGRRQLDNLNAAEKTPISNRNLEALKRHACAVVNRNLTVSEWEQYLSGETYRETCKAP